MNNHNRNISNCSYSIMSRRKQSNPKPLLKRDEDEMGSEANPTAPQEGIEEIETNDEQQQTESNVSADSPKMLSPRSKCSSPGSTNSTDIPNKSEIVISNCKGGEKRPLEDDTDENVSISPTPVAHVLSGLRLNVALASDPAANPDAKEIKIKNEESKSEDDDIISNNDENSSTLDASISLAKQHQLLQNKQKPDQVNNINALVPKTLDMVQRPTMFMCNPCGIRFSSHSTLEAHQTYYCSHRKDADENGGKAGASGSGEGTEPPNKAVKTGKQYACTQCSYSADKKVSLNRHMRMHQTSPTPSSTTSNGDENPSQILAQQIIGPPPQQIIDRYCSDCDIRFSSTKTYRAHKQHYCSSRHREGQPPVAPSPVAPKAPNHSTSPQSPPEAAKTPPAVPQQPFLALPTNPIIIIPYSLIRNASIIPGPLTTIAPNVANPDSACFIFQNGSLQPIAYSLAPLVSTSGNASSKQTSSTSQPSHTPSTTPQHDTKTTKSNAESASNNTGEVLKVVNKRDGTGRETTPLDLSVRRFSPGSETRERSLSLSSAISAEQLRMEFDAMMEGKENLSVSGDSVTPEQIVCAPSLPGSPPLTPSPKRRSNSPRAGNVSVSPNSSTSHSLLMRPMLPADIALRLSDPSLNVIPPQMLVKQSVELALRLSSTGSNDASPPQISPLLNMPQPPPLSSPNNVISPVVTPGLPVMPTGTLIKQGVSKCKECNIVFCKYENYLAHKKHYCSARNLEDSEGTVKSHSPESPQSKSPSGANLTYQQLICVACGIKFTSWDNLSAHQMYYCPKRVELQAQANSLTAATAVVNASSHKEKCSKCKSVHDPSQQCTVAGQGAYKCPICEVISPNSTEARRHMETHGGVKAFRCTICRYKGNTLRGMRTHIRMHLDKKSGDVNEENYISCILDDDSTEIPPAAAATNNTGHTLNNSESASSPQLYSCEVCNYSSTYKANVIRHTKLVHNSNGNPPKSPVIGEGGESLLQNDNGTKTPNELSVIKSEPQDESQDDEESASMVDEPPLIPESVIKVEITEKADVLLKTSRSPSISPEQSQKNQQNKIPTLLPPKIPSPNDTIIKAMSSPHANLISPQIPQPSPPLDMNTTSPNGSRYCTTCDIPFKFQNTFIAHKKFYCKANQNNMRPNNGPSPNAGASSVVVTRAAETSVLNEQLIEELG